MNRLFRSETPGITGYGSLLVLAGTFIFVMLLVLYPETFTGSGDLVSILR